MSTPIAACDVYGVSADFEPLQRRVTVMFCEMVDAAALSLKLDPEDFGALVESFRDISARCVVEGGGAVNKYTADGLLAVFDDEGATRACRAGLRILAALRHAAAPVRARLAAATGEVFAQAERSGAATELDALLGVTPNLAARLLALAPAGGMVADDETRALAGDGFAFEPCEFRELKGFDLPVAAWRLRGERGAEPAGGGDAAAVAPGGPASSAERRQLTTMFCDLVGSTALSRRLPPADYDRLIRSYQDICSRRIGENGGVVHKFLGDGVLAVFGYPHSSEEDAAQACRAALQIVAALQQLRPPVQVRIAAATGLVVSGDSAAELRTIVGSAPNLVASLQQIAPPNGVVVTEATRSLIGQAFELQDYGRHDLAGIDAPVPAWRILGERQLESRFAARRSGGPVGLIGRAAELDALVERWRQARTGAGQLVVLSGEAGIGKSRLMHELRERLAMEPGAAVVLQCSAQHASTTLHPISAHFVYAARIAGRDAPEERLEKLRRLVSRDPGDDGMLLPLLAELAGLPPPEDNRLAGLSPGQRKARTFAALGDWILRLSGSAPMLLAVEDYHWIDPTTAEWLDGLWPRLAAAPILCVVTTRSRRPDPPGGRPNPLTLELTRLGPAEAAEMVERLTAGASLPRETREAILSRTEGVPLFVEAMAKSVLEAPPPARGDRSGRGLPAALGVPMTLNELLTARLDALGPAKTAAQLGAVLGRTFSFETLSRISDVPADALRQSLARAVDAELLLSEGQSAEGEFTFKHALIQNAAYESLLLSKRQALHGRVADALARYSPAEIEAHPEQLAFHLTRAANFKEAARHWRRAGVLSQQRSANREAVLQFEAALDMLEAEGESRDRALELDALVGLTGALRATSGYSAEAVGESARRTLALARALGSDSGELQALAGLYSYHLVAAEYAEAEAYAEELMAAATRLGDSDYVMIGHRALGAVAYHCGRLREADENLGLALSLYEPERHAHLTSTYGANHAETCACFLSLTKWTLGKRSEAVVLQSWAVNHSREIGHAHSLAQAHAYRAFLHYLDENLEAAIEDALAALALAEEHRFVLMDSFARFSLAAARGRAAPDSGAADALEAAIARCLAVSMATLRPHFLTAAADLRVRAGEPRRALELVDLSEAIMAQTGEHWAQAETRRLRGRLLASLGDVAAARAALEQAIALAQASGAGSWRERAEADLAALTTARGAYDGLCATSA